jgi:hypothetical protein
MTAAARTRETVVKDTMGEVCRSVLGVVAMSDSGSVRASSDASSSEASDFDAEKVASRRKKEKKEKKRARKAEKSDDELGDPLPEAERRGVIEPQQPSGNCYAHYLFVSEIAMWLDFYPSKIRQRASRRW